MWTMPTASNDLTMEKGEDFLKDYEFGRNTMKHKVTCSFKHYFQAELFGDDTDDSKVLSEVRQFHHGSQARRARRQKNRPERMIFFSYAIEINSDHACRLACFMM